MLEWCGNVATVDEGKYVIYATHVEFWTKYSKTIYIVPIPENCTMNEAKYWANEHYEQYCKYINRIQIALCVASLVFCAWVFLT